MKKNYIYIILIVILAFLSACSVKNNNSFTRFYHNLTSRYNVLYNGELSFNEKYQEDLNNLNESYAKQIPVDPIAYNIINSDEENKNLSYQISIDKGRKAIEEHSIRSKPAKEEGWKKDPKKRAWHEKIEYNTYIYNAWLLTGKSQFYSGDMLAALSTFSFMNRLYKNEKEIKVKADIWLARCYNQMGWFIEAKDILSEVEKYASNNSNFNQNYLSNKSRLNKEDYTNYLRAKSNNLLGFNDKSKAIEVLIKLVDNESNDIIEYRLLFLIAQLYTDLGEKQKAINFYKKAASNTLSTDMELASNLNLLELSDMSVDKKLNKLKYLADKNRFQKYIDAITLHIGNAYISKKDTLNALKYYNLGSDSSKLKSLDYALNLIKIGDIYLCQNKYHKAYDAYSKAESSLKDNDKEKNKIKLKVEALEKIKVFSRQIEEQDSLQFIASLPKDKLKKHIDSLINIERKRLEKEEADKWREEVNQNPYPNNNDMNENKTNNIVNNSKFYFHNPELIVAGREKFRRIWGNITLKDNWQHKGEFSLNNEKNKSQSDSINQSTNNNELENKDTYIYNPLHEAYYLAKLPITDDAKNTSNAIISSALLEMGNLILLELGLENETLNAYNRIITQYPKAKERSEAIYRALLLQSYKSNKTEAERLRDIYIRDYPNGEMYNSLKSEDFIKDIMKIDSISNDSYTKAWNYYQKADYDSIINIYNQTIKRYPKLKDWVKFKMLLALSYAGKGSAENMKVILEDIKKENKEEDLTNIATYILDELTKGRNIIAKNNNLSIDLDLSKADIDNKAENKFIKFEFSKNKKYKILLIYPNNKDYKQSKIYFDITTFNYAYFTQNDIFVDEVFTSFANMILISNIEANKYIAALLNNKNASDIISNAIILPIIDDDISKITSIDLISKYLNDLEDNIDIQTYKLIIDHNIIQSK